MKYDITHIPEVLSEKIKTSTTLIEDYAKKKVHAFELKRDLSHKEKEIRNLLNEVQKHPGQRKARTGAIYRDDIEEITHDVAVLEYQCRNIREELKLPPK